MTKRPELDAVRGIAMLAVFLHHLLPGTRAGALGWAGVDLFFALSGYLLTHGLWAMRSTVHPARQFYQRRARRILPAYTVYLTTIALVATIPHAPWFFTPSVNLLVTRMGFGGLPYYLQHLWSLSTEEQVWFLLPILVFSMRVRRFAIGAAVCLLVIAALRAVLLLTHHGTPDALYVYRIDGLVAGALLATMMQTMGGRAVVRRVAPWALASGATVVALLAASHDSRWDAVPMQLVGYPALALASTGLVGLALTYRVRVTGVMYSLLRGTGIIAYSAYLVHVPLLHLFGPMFGTLYTVILAMVGYHFVEKPFLRRRQVSVPAT